MAVATCKLKIKNFIIPFTLVWPLMGALSACEAEIHDARTPSFQPVVRTTDALSQGSDGSSTDSSVPAVPGLNVTESGWDGMSHRSSRNYFFIAVE